MATAAPERLNAAGKPNTTPTAMDTRAVMASTVRSRRMSAMRGTSRGAALTSRCTPQLASRAPAAPPASASITLSTSGWRTSRQRGAPSAARTANSRWREAARARAVRPVRRHRLPVPLVAVRHRAEGRRHDADDARRPAGDRHRAPDDGPVGAEATPPQRFTEDDDPWAVGPCFLRIERAAEQRRGADHAEEVRRHGAALHILGLLTGEGETPP